MAEHSTIEWTEATWNPVTGCSVVSPGCTNCYAMNLAGTRLRNHPSRRGLTTPSKAGPVWNGKLRFNDEWLEQPIRWKRPRKIFVCAHGDLFHENCPDAWLDEIFAVMAVSPVHTFQVLTKRSRRMLDYVSAPGTPRRIYNLVCDRAGQGLASCVLMLPGGPSIGTPPKGPQVVLGTWPLPNVWLGVSVEDQARADERIPDLLKTPAEVPFLSVEPMLGPIKLPDAFLKFGPFAWVIVGGESGHSARPMHPAWVRALRDQCVWAGVPFFFKQWGEFVPDRVFENAPKRGVMLSPDGRQLQIEDLDAVVAGTFDLTGFQHLSAVGKKAAGRLLDGMTWDEMPDP